MVLAIVVAVLILVAGLARLAGPRLLLWDRGKILSLPRLVNPQVVQLDALPAMMQAMSRGTGKVRYAGMWFTTADCPSDDDAVNLNLSFKNGKLGFDWVLLAPRNVQDQEKFLAFARGHGIEPSACSMNGVSYFRVEDHDVAEFTASIVTDMYACPSTTVLGLVHKGFVWPG